MQELTPTQFQETFSSPMKAFKLTPSSLARNIESLAKDLLKRKGISPQQLHLAYCYENGTETFAHYLITWGPKDQYLVLISAESEQQWYGYYLLNLQTEYGIKENIS